MSAINADQMVTIRAAVAEQHRRNCCPELAERTERGEMDTTPMMQAAVTAVERVLEGMFG